MVGVKSQRAIGPIKRLLDRGAFGHLTDAQLLERFHRKADSNAAFETLVLRHGPAVLRTCRRILGDRGESDDAFQATFLVLARRASSISPAPSVGPWLQGVARRIALKARTAAIRRRYHERQTAVSILFEPGTRAELSEALREEVDRLPEHLRAPVVLFYLERASYTSAALKLGLTEATIRGRLAKAREVLKLRLSRDRAASSPRSRPESASSSEQKMPLLLLEATTRAAIAFSNHAADKTRIASSVLKMAEGALTMMFMTRIVRVVFIAWLATAGTALVGLRTSGAGLATLPTLDVRESFAPSDLQTHPDQPTNTIQIDPKRAEPRDILIQGKTIQIKADTDQISVDGPGSLSLWVDRGLLTNKADDLAQAASTKPTLLTISWTGRMQFKGRTIDRNGRPIGRANLQGQVTAQMDDESIRCEEQMIVNTTQPVPLERVQITASSASPDLLSHQPRTKIAGIRAFRNIIMIGSMLDPDKHVLLNQQQFRADGSLDYDTQAGSYHISGKGRVCLEYRTHDSRSPANRRTAVVGRIDIAFIRGMIVTTSRDDKANAVTPEAYISGSVTLTAIDSIDAKTVLAPKEPLIRPLQLTAQNVRVVSKSHTRDSQRPNRSPLRIDAIGHVSTTFGNSSMEVDEMHFVLPVE